MRITLSILFFVSFLIGCEPTKIAFSPANINTTYVKSLLRVAKQGDTNFTAGKIFIAELVEDYVDRDGIAEETIVNTSSAKPKLRLAKKGLSYRLFVITTDAPQHACIFLPTIFNGEDTCIGLGPASIGVWGAGELKFFKKLEFYANRKTGKGVWKYPKKDNEYSGSHSIYDPHNSARTKIEIKFVADVKKNLARLDSFKITDIINVSENRFGGVKPLIFNIASIFEDSAALSFIKLDSLQ